MVHGLTTWPAGSTSATMRTCTKTDKVIVRLLWHVPRQYKLSMKFAKVGHWACRSLQYKLLWITVAEKRKIRNFARCQNSWFYFSATVPVRLLRVRLHKKNNFPLAVRFSDGDAFAPGISAASRPWIQGVPLWRPISLCLLDRKCTQRYTLFCYIQIFFCNLLKK